MIKITLEHQSTSGLDGRYPTNYPVAEVTRVEKIVGEAFLQAEARPLVNLLTMREALLLWLEMAEEENPPTELSANESP